MSEGIPIEETIEEALIDLYLGVKVRSTDDVSPQKIWSRSFWRHFL